MDRSNTDLRVVTGPAGLDVEGTPSAQQLRNAWTRMSKASPRFSRAQFVAWLQILGERDDDQEFSDCAEEYAKRFFDQESLEDGRAWSETSMEYLVSNAVPDVWACIILEGVNLMPQSWTDSTQDMGRFHVDRPVAGITPQPVPGNNEGLLKEPSNAQTHRPWTENMQGMEQSDADRPVVGVTPQPAQGNNEGLLKEPLHATTRQSMTENPPETGRSAADCSVCTGPASLNKQHTTGPVGLEVQRPWTTTTPQSCTEMHSPLSRSTTSSISRQNSENYAHYMDAHQGVTIYPVQFAREGLMHNMHSKAEGHNYRSILEDVTQQQTATLVSTPNLREPADNRSKNIPEPSGQGVKGGGTDPP